MAMLKFRYARLNREITFEAFMEKYKDVTSLDEIVGIMTELPGKPSTGESLHSGPRSECIVLHVTCF